MMTYRIQQFLILVLHLILLYWIYFALNGSGGMTQNEVLMHFVGMGIYGALLIRGCAAWGKYWHKKEQQ